MHWSGLASDFGKVIKTYQAPVITEMATLEWPGVWSYPFRWPPAWPFGNTAIAAGRHQAYAQGNGDMREREEARQQSS